MFGACHVSSEHKPTQNALGHLQMYRNIHAQFCCDVRFQFQSAYSSVNNLRFKLEVVVLMKLFTRYVVTFMLILSDHYH